MVQTCHTRVSMDDGSFPPTQSKSCTTHVGAWSEPRGCSRLLNGPENHQLCTPAPQMPLGMKQSKLGIRGGGLPLIPAANPVMNMTVVHQLTRLQVHWKLWAAHPLSKLVLIQQPLTCYLYRIELLQVMPDCAERLTDHPKCFPDVFPQAEPAKEPHQDIEPPLHPHVRVETRRPLPVQKNDTILWTALP